MAKDSLDKVKTAEISAKLVVEKAKENAKIMVDQAQIEKQTRMTAVDNEINETQHEFTKETEFKASDIKSSISKETNRRLELIENMAKQNNQDALTSVLELILE